LTESPPALPLQSTIPVTRGSLVVLPSGSVGLTTSSFVQECIDKMKHIPKKTLKYLII